MPTLSTHIGGQNYNMVKEVPQMEGLNQTWNRIQENNQRIENLDKRNQLYAARSGYAKDLMLLEADFDPANNDIEEFATRADELRQSHKDTIKYQDVSDEFTLESDLHKTKAIIEAQGKKKLYTIGVAKDNWLSDFERAQEIVDPIERQDTFQALRASGVSEGLFHHDRAQRVYENSVYAGMLQDADQDKDTSLAMLKELEKGQSKYDITPNQKLKAARDLTSIHRRQEQEYSYKVEKQKTDDVLALAVEEIGTGPTKTYKGFWEAIEERKESGRITEKEADSFKAVLNQHMGIQYSTDATTFSNLSRELDRFDTNKVPIDKTLTPQKQQDQVDAGYYQYMRDVRDYQVVLNTAYANKQLNYGHYRELTKNLEKKTALRNSQITNNIIQDPDKATTSTYEAENNTSIYNKMLRNTQNDSIEADKMFLDYSQRLYDMKQRGEKVVNTQILADVIKERQATNRDHALNLMIQMVPQKRGIDPLFNLYEVEGGATEAQPTTRAPKPQQYEDGKTYTNARGEKAVYKNGQFLRVD